MATPATLETGAYKAATRARVDENEEGDYESRPMLYNAPPPRGRTARLRAVLGRWLSLEFIILWYPIAAFGYFFLFWNGYKVSNLYNEGKGPTPIYDLEKGWIPGRKEDLSDGQWSSFRQYLPAFLVGMVVYLVIRYIIHFIVAFYTRRRSALDTPSQLPRMIFYLIISIGYIFYLHRSFAIYVVALVVFNYFMAKALDKSPLLPIATWLYCLAILSLHEYLPSTWVELWGRNSLTEFLDKYPQLYEIVTVMNLNSLRMISFNMDYYWMRTGKVTTMKLEGQSEYTRLQETSRAASQYGFLQYLVYVLYTPLYISGPIISFNAFIAQMYSPIRLSIWKRVLYFLRMCTAVLVLEVLLQYFYFNSLITHKQYYDMPPWEVFFCGLFEMYFKYMVFLIVWRFARSWALLDAIEPPENMRRCVNNNFTFTGFWRSWHASFNVWIIRYLYIPLGGKKYKAFVIWPVFLFVGLWHSIEWRNVAWAMTNCCFFAVEIIVMSIFMGNRRLRTISRKWWFRYVIAVAGAFDIYCLMLANLSMELYGVRYTWGLFFRYVLGHASGYPDPAVPFTDVGIPGLKGPVLFPFLTLWLAALVMFMREIRATEKRAGFAPK